MWVGQSFNTPFFDNKNFADWKDHRGRIFVNQYFQVTNQNPEIEYCDELKQDPLVYENIFCYGDAWITMMKEVKNVPTIRETSYIVAHNLKALLNGKKLMKMPYAVNMLSAVYFSKYSGAIIFNDFALPSRWTLLSKKLIECIYLRYYKNKCWGSWNYKIFTNGMKSALCWFNTWLWWCSWSNRKIAIISWRY